MISLDNLFSLVSRVFNEAIWNCIAPAAFSSFSSLMNVSDTSEVALMNVTTSKE